MSRSFTFAFLLRGLLLLSVPLALAAVYLTAAAGLLERL